MTKKLFGTLLCAATILALSAGAALAEPKIEVKTGFLVIEGAVTDDMLAQALEASKAQGNRPSKTDIWLEDMDDATLQKVCKAFADHTGIKISDSDELTGLAPLAEMKKLHKVSLIDLPNVTDISILASFPDMTFLTVRKVPHTEKDLTLIAEMEELLWLDLSNLPKTFGSLKGIENKPRLKNVGLSFSKVPDLTPLTTLPSLEKVNLDFSRGEDLTPLAGIASLKEVSIKKGVFPEDQVKALKDAGKQVKN